MERALARGDRPRSRNGLLLLGSLRLRISNFKAMNGANANEGSRRRTTTPSEGERATTDDAHTQRDRPTGPELTLTVGCIVKRSSECTTPTQAIRLKRNESAVASRESRTATQVLHSPAWKAPPRPVTPNTALARSFIVLVRSHARPMLEPSQCVCACEE